MGDRIYGLYQEIDSRDLRGVKTEEFIAWFKQLWQDFVDLNGVGLVPVVSDYYHSYLSIELNDILKKRNLTDALRQEHLNLLMNPDRPNIPWHEQLDLLSLVHKHKDLKTLKRSAAFRGHLKKYEWLNYGYQGPAIKPEDFLARAAKLLKDKRKLKSELAAHRNYFKRINARQRQIEKKLQLTRREKYLFESARVFTYLKGYRIDVRHYFHFICDLMFAELGRRFRVPLIWFHYAERPEILALLRGKKINKKAILKRYRGMFWFIEQHKRPRFVPRSQVKAFYKKYIRSQDVQDATELIGQPAYLGKARGRVKIVNSVKDVTKVEHGDILVAITTNPDLLPAMYRANAFVTDTGGITSHVAIVARELKKPCVIGTKFATKVFKDGDLVEVDANKGIVRKIK